MGIRPYPCVDAPLERRSFKESPRRQRIRDRQRARVHTCPVTPRSNTSASCRASVSRSACVPAASTAISMPRYLPGQTVDSRGALTQRPLGGGGLPVDGAVQPHGAHVQDGHALQRRLQHGPRAPRAAGPLQVQQRQLRRQLEAADLPHRCEYC